MIWGQNLGLATAIVLASNFAPNCGFSQTLEGIQPQNLSFWDASARCAALFKFSGGVVYAEAGEHSDGLDEVLQSLSLEYSRLSLQLSMMSLDLALKLNVVHEDDAISFVQNAVDNYFLRYVRYTSDHSERWLQEGISKIDFEVCTRLATIADDQGYAP
ncbi:hypothetical protein [Roseovarius sp. Pro17]|uniref:hypothetical protein n=1 Tax=Roseovarius sp. Pro17 TaxID=3108175 RepID=UPI002D7A3A82|nr:hypothetical protein [Roseovarius sp. Pro17]